MSLRTLVVVLVVQLAIAASFAVIAIDAIPSIFAGATHHPAAKSTRVSDSGRAGSAGP